MLLPQHRSGPARASEPTEETAPSTGNNRHLPYIPGFALWPSVSANTVNWAWSCRGISVLDFVIKAVEWRYTIPFCPPPGCVQNTTKRTHMTRNMNSSSKSNQLWSAIFIRSKAEKCVPPSLLFTVKTVIVYSRHTDVADTEISIPFCVNPQWVWICLLFLMVNREQPTEWVAEVFSGHSPHEVRTSLHLSDRPLCDHVNFSTGDSYKTKMCALCFCIHSLTSNQIHFPSRYPGWNQWWQWGSCVFLRHGVRQCGQVLLKWLWTLCMYKVKCSLHINILYHINCLL